MMQPEVDRLIQILKRCNGCDSCKSIAAGNGQELSVCCHEPYTEKWILEIARCPKPQGTLIEPVPAKPRITTAHWINPSRNPEFVNKDFFSDCSNCGNTVSLDQEGPECPRCKAKMTGTAIAG